MWHRMIEVRGWDRIGWKLKQLSVIWEMYGYTVALG